MFRVSRSVFHIPSDVSHRLYAQDVREEHGPFTVIRGSHATSPAKLKWLYEVSNAPPKYGPASYGSFRLRDYQEGKADAEGGEATNEHPSAPEGFPDPKAIVGPALTLLIADTSSLHARGLSIPGTVRKVRVRMSCVCLCVGVAMRGMGRLLAVRYLPSVTCHHHPDVRARWQPYRWWSTAAQSLRDGKEPVEGAGDRGVRGRGSTH